MVQGIKFLSKKGFNPQNLSNQKRVWEAEQRDKEQARTAEERRRQLQRERDDEELLKSRGEIPRVSFLYDVPPGLQGKPKGQDDDSETKPAAAVAVSAVGGTATETCASASSSNLLTASQPDDDEATAAFRKLLAGATSTEHATTSTEEDAGMAGKFGVTLQGTAYDAYDDTDAKAKLKHTSALEKAAGRKTKVSNLTLDEQIQRFPVLANAPRAKGMTATDVNVSFKPLGSQIRNVKCMACGVWGHSRGDRECRISGWDPFATSVVPEPSRPVVERKRQDVSDEPPPRKDQKKRRRRSDHSTGSDDSSNSRRRRKDKKKRKKSKKHKKSSRNDH